MVTYQIQLPKSKRDAFLNIIRSLQSLGAVSSFSDSANITHPGAALPVETLLDILKVGKASDRKPRSFCKRSH
jgi:hypothetical protein